MSKLPTKTFRERRESRRRRVRGRVSGTVDRPRLTVFRSNRYLYVQVIDDVAGRTLLGLDDREIESKSAVAKELGLKLAKQCLAKKIKQVTFDRAGYRYAGRVKELAEGARSGGLIF
ncbi:MAG: 50S ribosomal protein L18 [Patescibacteria group bacterium]